MTYLINLYNSDTFGIFLMLCVIFAIPTLLAVMALGRYLKWDIEVFNNKKEE